MVRKMCFLVALLAKKNVENRFVDEEVFSVAFSFFCIEKELMAQSSTKADYV